MPRIGPCQVLAATLTLSQPGGGGQIMPTLYWGPWLVKIRRGGPEPYSAHIYKGEILLIVQNISGEVISKMIIFVHKMFMYV